MLELSLHLDNSYCNGYSRDPAISWELEETHRISFTGPEVESNPHYKETRGLMGVNLLLKWTQVISCAQQQWFDLRLSLPIPIPPFPIQETKNTFAMFVEKASIQGPA